MSTALVRFTAILLLLSFTVGCDDEKDGEVDVQPTPRAPGIRAPEGEERVEEIVIYDDRVEPRQLNLTAGVPAQIQVANRGNQDCQFFIGEFLTGLRVPAGTTAKMGMTVPGDRTDAAVRMGCTGDETRQGSAVIEFKGLLPGSGR